MKRIAFSAVLLLMPFAQFACDSANSGVVDSRILQVVGKSKGPTSASYERTKWYPGLRQDVTTHKGRDGLWCRIGTGPHVSCEDIIRQERSAYRNRYGVFNQRFADELSTASPDVSVAASIFFAVETGEGLKSTDPQIRAAAKSALREAIALEGARIENAIISEGGEVTHHVRNYIPTLSIRATPPVLARVGRLPGITSITANRASRPVPLSSGPTQSITFSEVDTTFNSGGFYGQGERVGIIEGQGGCQLYDQHDAFQSSSHAQAGTPVKYPNPADFAAWNGVATCIADSQCQSVCGASRCIAGWCVDAHATAVASVISTGRADTGYGASAAMLYYWPLTSTDQVFPPSGARPLETAGCNKDVVSDAYDWFIANDVHIVNESWACVDENASPPYGNAAQVEGIVQDWAARVHDIFISKAASHDGNLAACPWTLNSMCVGSTNASGQMVVRSSFQNPDGSDREEPDIAAFGGEDRNGHLVDVAALANPSAWEGSTGTSFAAPQIAQFVALRRSKCGTGDALSDRALLKLRATKYNPEGMAYSTPAVHSPGVDTDWRDGAGVVDTAKYADCTPPSPSVTGIDLSDGVTAPTSEWCARCGEPIGLESATPMANGDGRRYKRLTAPGEIIAPYATRIRAVLSWNSCSERTAPSAPGQVGVDFDLFLVDEATHTPLYSSHSNDDNNEGFDVNIYDLLQFPYVADLSIWVAWPETASPCAPGTTIEPTAFWYTFE